MVALVATERRLWLNLSNIKGKDKNFLMDAPISTSGLFGGAMNLVVERFNESANQAAAFQKLLPRCIHISGAAEREQPQTSKSSSSHRATQKQSVAYRAPPHKDWGHGKHTQPQPSKCKTDLRTVINSKKARGKRSWHPRAQASEDLPPQSRVVNTSFYGARLPSMSSGDWSANPATSCASGCSGLQRAHIPRSTRKRSGLGMPAPSEEGFGVVSSDASCRFTASGRHSDCTNTYKSRNQSREAGTSSRIFDSVETSAKYASLGLADYRKKVSNTVRVSPAQVHGGFVHRGGPPASSCNGTGNKSSVRERGHRICTSLQQGNRVLQLVFPNSSKEGWRVASHFRSSSFERIRHAAQVQNVNFETNLVTDQIRGLVCHDRSQGHILSHIHPSLSQEVPEVRPWYFFGFRVFTLWTTSTIGWF